MLSRSLIVIYFLKNFVLAGLVFVAVCAVSLVAASRGYCLVVVHRLLIAVSSLVAEHGL